MADRCGSLSYTVDRSSNRSSNNFSAWLPDLPGGLTHVDTSTGSPQSADRRTFVRAMGVLTGMVALSHPLAALLPGRAWAVELRALSSAEAATLLAMVRTIAPHDTLDDSAYALVVKAVDEDAAGSAEARAALKTGVAGLGEGFSALPEEARALRLGAIESGAFFQSVRIKTLMVLYSNPIAWAHFGYEGESFSKGGYLLRASMI